MMKKKHTHKFQLLTIVIRYNIIFLYKDFHYHVISFRLSSISMKLAIWKICWNHNDTNHFYGLNESGKWKCIIFRTTLLILFLLSLVKCYYLAHAACCFCFLFVFVLQTLPGTIFCWFAISYNSNCVFNLRHFCVSWMLIFTHCTGSLVILKKRWFFYKFCFLLIQCGNLQNKLQECKFQFCFCCCCLLLFFFF